ncbi:MAG TPA: acetate kinase [bacterium]|nr:acetate kinase [bacterium]
MNILVLNCGSSSVKFQLIETSLDQMAARTDRVLARGQVQRIGEPEPMLEASAGEGPSKSSRVHAQNHDAALDAVFEWMSVSRVLENPEEIQGVGHRVVHGGGYFKQSVVIDDATLLRIQACNDLAPLHNPHNLEGYFASRKRLPNAPHVAVFDTAFHQTLPPRAFLYGLPWAWYESGRIRHYGFHGTSYRYVMHRFAQLRQSRPDAFKLITCHLGNGCSACAIENGKSIDTSMGFTPLEGLLMGTRVGDLGAGALLYILKLFGMSLQDAEAILNDKSGIAALSGVSQDMREVLRAAREGNSRARIAVEVFCYRVATYVGAYFVALDGADALIFTGGIGENSAEIRSSVCQLLRCMGAELNDEANRAATGVEREISRQDSRLAVWVIPTDEERMIAHDTLRCILGIQCL